MEDNRSALLEWPRLDGAGKKDIESAGQDRHGVADERAP